MMNRLLFFTASLLGAAAILWVGAGFIGGHALAFGVTLLIAVAYTIGIAELHHYRRDTDALARALSQAPSSVEPDTDPLPAWLERLPISLRHTVGLRIAGEWVPLPGPVFTPYLVGLLVMLGLLGTFFGLVDTLSGAVTALEGSTELAAIRSGLAAPIAGLGVAFGTSVAGVAASAMLGLGATLSRRERLSASRELDLVGRRVFAQYSSDYRQQQAFDAMRAQAAALPDIVERLDGLSGQLLRMGRDLSETLTDNQAAFHQSTASEFRTLADTVGESLRTSLADSGRLAGEAIRPPLEAAFADFVERAERSQQRLAESTGEQVAKVSTRLSDVAKDIQGVVNEGTGAQVRANARFLEELGQSMATHADELVATQRAHTEQFTTEIGRLLAGTEELVQARADTEQRWSAQHEERMASLVGTVAGELEQLRKREEHQAEAALQRLDALEASAAKHLAQLGDSLEAPMTRLIETASETPRAAAEVIASLRKELSDSMARDNELLQERQTVLERLQGLTDALEGSSVAQREAVAGMVEDSAGALRQLGERFGEQVEAGVARLDDLAGDVSGSAVEVASLGDAFQAAVQQFGESNRALIESLDRIEQALEQAGARSDEQLGYYVAQAREIIDHSVLSQKEIVEALHQVGRQEALFEAGDA